MTSSATTRNRFEKQGTGDNNNTWGSVLNSAVFDLVDSALDGMVSFSLSTTKTLTSTNYAADESRMRFVNVTGGTGGTVTIPALEKWYLVRNGSTGDVIFTTGSGDTATVKSGNIMPIVCDGTNVYLGSAPDFGSSIPKTSGTPTSSTHLTNKNYVDTQIAAAATGTSLASGMATFLATPSSANLRATMTDETGTGSAVFATAPTLTNPVVGTQSPGDNSTKAASTAYVDAAVAASGYTQLATVTPSGTGTATLIGLSGDYSDLLVVINGVSHNSGSNQSLNMYVSPDGASFGTAYPLLALVAGTGAYKGVVFVPGYAFGVGTMSHGLTASGSDPVVAAGATTSNIAWVCTGGIDALKFEWSGGNFDAGTITVYAR